MNPNHQDWDTVIIRKKAPSQAALKDEGAVNAARRTGAAVETVKKFTAGSNKVNLGTATSTGKSAVKLEAETEDFHRERPRGAAAPWRLLVKGAPAAPTP
jgi:putative transcription factor